MTEHRYESQIRWTGNTGSGTRTYSGYDRTWSVEVPGKAPIPCSNDPLLGGDPALMNPEDLLLSSLSACHMLWYLHLASQNKIEVTAYCDTPQGVGQVDADGSGEFTAATLQPQVTITPGSDAGRAQALHWDIHKYCFIARSVKFPISYAPRTFIHS